MRKRERVNPLNLDPLVDTMTNVFGVLMILVLGTHLVVADTASKAGEIQLDITPKDLQEAEREADKLESLLKELREYWSRLERESSEKKVSLFRLREEIEKLRKELLDPTKTSLDGDALRQLIMDHQKASKEIEAKIGSLEDELQKLMAQLEERRSGSRDKPLIARLPNPRPAPEGSVPVIFFCRYGRIIRLDKREDFNYQQVVEGVRLALNTNAEKIVIKPSDYQRIVNYFDQNVIGNSDFRWRVFKVTDNGEAVLLLKIEWRHKNAGDTSEQIEHTTSAYLQELKSLDKQKQWISFIVWSDCFDVYPKAREIASKQGFSAGWAALDIEQELILPFFPSSESDQSGAIVPD